ncbi:single-stranded DNA-binding protein [Candidatus Shapirobacteria bacterium CG09_land_8_20_14_0_10_47_13]|uniref:Single-stranded DNA-binding protein n=1 Tax=Candidatus Shapirobacteria bacterium CG09_land_8_20_14_0_10_47_13 TaxID=1974481 RepID=A0A2H0WMF8_9BACT|nr:MAG: single-stranded DNA-binding protein [Candidatus Shapirobacteria bacterium CG09_land_8_20_14_0_10_47_13]
MAQRSLNKVQLIGNLTRDPELRYTPQGTAVCTLGLATNRSWTTDTGEKREEVEFHRLVAWNKLAELCSQLLFKGRKLFVEGRLQTRSWTGQDGAQRQTTEIVLSDMIILDAKRAPGEPAETAEPGPVEPAEPVKTVEPAKPVKPAKDAEPEKTAPEETTDVKAEDIPF